MQGRLFRVSPALGGGTIVAKVTPYPDLPQRVRRRYILYSETAGTVPLGYSAYVSGEGASQPWRRISGTSLSEGDVVRIAGTMGEVLYRRGSDHNTLLVTERCNCSCEMCVQPPRTSDDRTLLADLHRAITLFAKDTTVLGISGGEPTLLRGELVRLLRWLRSYLPATRLHLLSNARLFRYRRFAADVGKATDNMLTVGVPLNSDVPRLHDEIAGSQHAFDETVRGVLNLHRHGIAVEIRVVLTRSIVARIEGIAGFIRRNLPFACHVAFMGMETVGNAAANVDRLWVDPADFVDRLESAVGILRVAGIPTSIYNLQLCLLPRSLWRVARRSISDWKVEYLPVCLGCAQRHACCGFFGTDGMRASRAIAQITE
ncbi:MAG: His-Xaa-Ser system radical SAM maturase HxsC [Acidobacteria bacterium]|nr:His-Xaa-Ser system radical SAM maturase HxsC [Acidobacteriota bacterium]